jgi:predicted HicB family RNase H-like nuclease
MGSTKETTSIKIDPELWREAKIYAIKKGISISNLLEQLIKKELKK